MACSFNAAEQNPGSLSLLLSDSPSDSCAALNLINAAVFCDCARTKTGLMDSRLPFRSLFCFSKARWFNKPAPFDSQGLNPPGEETKTRPKKKGKKTKNPKCSRFFFFSSNPSFFFFLDFPTRLAAARTRLGSPPPAVPVPPLPPLAASPSLPSLFTIC